MIFKIREERFVMGLFFIALATEMISILEGIPFKGILNKIQYLYIIVVLFYNIKDKVLVTNIEFKFAFALLLVHTLVFGLLFQNQSLKDMTTSHLQQLLTVYALVLFTVVYVRANNCLLYFLYAIYFALASQTMLAAFLNFHNFVNPIYYYRVFSRTSRFRASFGYGDVNYCGNYCLYALIVTFIIWEIWKKGKISVYRPVKYAMAIIAFLQVCMLFSTASRSGILSLVIFLTTYYLQKKWDWIVARRKFFIPIALILVIAIVCAFFSTGIFSSIWSDSNREGNFSINYPIFIENGNLLKGMGYVDNSGFLNKVYGYETTAMDVYYLYILFSTGYLGAALIFGQMLFLFIVIFRHRKEANGNLSLSLFVMMLFYSIWQVNYMNYRYYTSVFHMVFIFYFILSIEKKNKLKII